MDFQLLAISEDRGECEEEDESASCAPSSSSATTAPSLPYDGPIKHTFKLVKVKADGTYVTPNPPSPSRFTSDGKFKLKWPEFTQKNKSTSTDSNESSTSDTQGQCSSISDSTSNVVSIFNDSGCFPSASDISTEAQCSSIPDSTSTDKDDSNEMWKMAKVNPDGSYVTPPQSPASAERPILEWKWN